MLILFYIFVFIIGACLGSFLCCQARRLYRRTAAPHPKSLSPAKNKSKGQRQKTSKSTLPPHSICLSCKTKLKWYDNIPIVSWLLLKGKCRKCRTRIGLAEFLAEVLTALSFLCITVAFFAPYVTSIEFIPTTLTPFSWAIYIITLILVTVMIFLAIYDGLYKELPVFALVIAAVLAVVVAILKICQYLSIHAFTATVITNPIFAVLILGGLYFVLYLVSKGRWVGDGDYILGAIIGLALGTPWLALIALFLANLTATLVMYPTFKGKNKRKQKIPFGPFLVTALVLTLIFADIFNSII